MSLVISNTINYYISFIITRTITILRLYDNIFNIKLLISIALNAVK